MTGSPGQACCAVHPDQLSIATCACCGRPLCEQCRVDVLATEEIYCSEHCRGAASSDAHEHTVSNAALAAGLKSPIVTGWGLWARSLGPLSLQVLPLSVAIGATLWLLGRVDPPPAIAESPAAVVWITFAAIVITLGYGGALVGVVLAQRHTGLVRGNPHIWTAKRLFPWLATWMLILPIIMIGYLALIFPGIYLSLRLFWADEFALVHGKGPIAALRASWQLTRKAAGPVFMFQFILGLAQNLILVPAIIGVTALLAGLESIGWSHPDRLTIFEGVVLPLILFIVYGAMHAPELAEFYGMRAARASLTPDELTRSDWLQRAKNRLT